jgi:uncharacterized protein (DUF2164 family)
VITLSPDTARRLRSSIKQYFAEHHDDEIGDLKAEMFLDFCLKEIAPTVYNKAVADAQAFMAGRVADLEGVCYEQEFMYWAGKKK